MSRLAIPVDMKPRFCGLENEGIISEGNKVKLRLAKSSMNMSL